MGKKGVSMLCGKLGNKEGKRAETWHVKFPGRTVGERADKGHAGKKACAYAAQAAAAALFLSLYMACPVYAATGVTNTGVIKTGFNVVYDIIAAIISSVGQLYLLWGVFEWATALNSQDGTMQSMAFKRIAAGLIACITPQLIPLITSGIGK